MKAIVVAIALMTAGLDPVYANESTRTSESEVAALKGRLTFVAFRCARYYSEAGRLEDHERMFQYGLSQGREFLVAHSQGVITPEDFEEHVPNVVKGSLWGPPGDFQIGLIFAVSADITDILLSEAARTAGNITRAELAAREASSYNCDIVGR